MRSLLLPLILLAAMAGLVAILFGVVGGGAEPEEIGSEPAALDPRVRPAAAPDRVAPVAVSAPSIEVHRLGDAIPPHRQRPPGWDERPVPRDVLQCADADLGRALLDWVGRQGRVLARDASDLEALVGRSYEELRAGPQTLARVLAAWRLREFEVEVRYPVIFVRNALNEAEPEGEDEPQAEWPPPER